MFDEKNIDSRSSYNQREDRVLGPHKNVQVEMGKSLISDWKQPVFYNFDVSINANILKNNF